MKKSDISLEEQWKCVTNILERVQKRGGAMLLIEQEILLNQLQGMYHGVIDSTVVAEEPYNLAEVEQRLSPAPAPQPIDNNAVQLPAPTPAAVLDALVAATVADYAAARPNIIAPQEEAPAPLQFAHVPEEERVTFHQPTMEELEGEQNKELFEEEPAAEVSLPEEPQSADATPSPSLQPVENIPPQPAAPRPEPQPMASQPTAEPSLFDLLNQSRGTTTGSNAHTLGETLAQPAHVEEAMSEQPQRNKVADLRTIININDKFSFMGELFHNNMKGYNDFISHLNALTRRDEALSYVAEIAKQYKWNEESLAVKTFYAIFDRKF